MLSMPRSFYGPRHLTPAMTAITYFQFLNQAMRLDREGRSSEACDLITENGEKGQRQSGSDTEFQVLHRQQARS
jgi:hypothetical protein